MKLGAEYTTNKDLQTTAQYQLALYYANCVLHCVLEADSHTSWASP